MPLPTPVVTADEVFAANKKVRWVALTTDTGQVLLNQNRPKVPSHSPHQVDEDFARLGPLTLLGVSERYSGYLEGVEYVTVGYGLVVCVYGRLGAQVLTVTIEKDEEAYSAYLEWFRKKKASVSKPP